MNSKLPVTWQYVDEAVLQSVLRITADAGRCFRVAVGNFLQRTTLSFVIHRTGRSTAAIV